MKIYIFNIYLINKYNFDGIVIIKVGTHDNGAMINIELCERNSRRNTRSLYSINDYIVAYYSIVVFI